MDLWTNFWCITLKEPNYSGVWWPMTDGLSGQFWTFPHQPRLCRLAMVNPWSEPFVATQRRPSILAVGGPSGCPQPNKNGMPKWCALPDALLYPRKVANSNEDDADLDKEDTGDVPWRSSNRPCRRGCFFSFFLMMGIWILSLWPKPRVVDNLAPIGNHLQSLKKTCFFDWAYPIIIQKMAHIPMLLGPKKNLASLVSGDEHRGHHWHWPCPVEVSYNLFVT